PEERALLELRVRHPLRLLLVLRAHLDLSLRRADRKGARLAYALSPREIKSACRRTVCTRPRICGAERAATSVLGSLRHQVRAASRPRQGETPARPLCRPLPGLPPHSRRDPCSAPPATNADRRSPGA